VQPTDVQMMISGARSSLANNTASQSKQSKFTRMPFKSKQANYDACMVSGYDGVFSRKQGSMHLEQLLVRFQVT